jgi:MoaA/NifB/PqqE/SkfB family radical SAM enzyme
MPLSKPICKELVENNCLEMLRFSFDGSKKETIESIRKGINYDHVIGNMRLMADLKKRHHRKNLTLLIRYVAMRSNIEELPDLVIKASQWGIDVVEVTYLNVSNGMDKNESLFYYSSLAKRFFVKSAEVAKSVNIRIILPEAGNETRDVKICSRPWQFIKIDPGGSVRFCYKAWENPIGNILSADFFDLWNNYHYRLIRKTINSEKPYFKYCKVCSRRRGYALESSHIQYLHSDLYSFDMDYEKAQDVGCP